MLRKRHRLLLREVKRQDAVLKLGLDVFFIDILADVEASLHILLSLIRLFEKR